MGTQGKARKQLRFISLRKIAALFPLDTQFALAEASQLPKDLSDRLNPEIDPHELFILWQSTQSSVAVEQDKLNISTIANDIVKSDAAQNIESHTAVAQNVESHTVYGCLPLSKLNHDLCFSSALLERYPFFRYLKLDLCCQFPLPPSLLSLQRSSNFQNTVRINAATTVYNLDNEDNAASLISDGDTATQSYNNAPSNKARNTDSNVPDNAHDVFDFSASLLSFLQEHAFWKLSLAYAPQYILKMLKQLGIDPRLITSTDPVDADISSLSMAFYLPQSQFIPEQSTKLDSGTTTYAAQPNLTAQVTGPSHGSLVTESSHGSQVLPSSLSSQSLSSTVWIESLAAHSGLADQKRMLQTANVSAPVTLESFSNTSLETACSASLESGCSESLESAISNSSLNSNCSNASLDSACVLNKSHQYGQGAWLLDRMQRVLTQGISSREQIWNTADSFEPVKSHLSKSIEVSKERIKDDIASMGTWIGEARALGAGAASWQGGANIQKLDPSLMMEAEKYMAVALELAQQAADIGEVPVGAVLVDESGNIVARGFNRTIMDSDITAHAEMVAFRQAGQVLSNHRLNQLTLYVTLEPCCMCAMAAIHARIKRIIFGAVEYKTGACGSQFNLALDPRHNHRLEIYGGVMHQQCRELLQDFFMRRRSQLK